MRAGRDEFACLAFRGTDGSFAGWKEDFNLCFKEVIPSQRAAAAYLSGVASAVEGPLVACGHSKGGNLAEFAALVVDEGAYARLAGVYNHDGPSFLDDPSPRIHDGRFATLLHKTVPESSAFGMILERRPDYRVVQSSALSVFQHEPFSWQVDGDDFVYQDALNRAAVFFDEALDAWLRGKTPAERERFIDTIYELFASTEASTLGRVPGAAFSRTRGGCWARARSWTPRRRASSGRRSAAWVAYSKTRPSGASGRPRPPGWRGGARRTIGKDEGNQRGIGSGRHRGRRGAGAPYGRLSARMALQLAAPHTWPAAILPRARGRRAPQRRQRGGVSATMACVLLDHLRAHAVGGEHVQRLLRLT